MDEGGGELGSGSMSPGKTTIGSERSVVSGFAPSCDWEGTGAGRGEDGSMVFVTVV